MTAKKFANVSDSKKLLRFTGRFNAAGCFISFPSVSVWMMDHKRAAARYFVILTPTSLLRFLRSSTWNVPWSTAIWSKGRNSPLTWIAGRLS